MTLSRAEKLAGREFRARARQLMELSFAEMPGAEIRPLFLHFVRHECPRHAGRTWAVQLREYIVYSPPCWVCYCSAVLPEPHDDCDGGVQIEEALFGYVWRAGSCPCGFTVRSDTGRVVVAADRAPLHGATEVRLGPAG